jgi:AraC-like DNA-binding protein
VNQQIDIKNKLDEGLTFKISRFKEQIKRTNPHKHDEYYELIFLSEGEGFHCIESEKYMIDVPDFYFLKPRQLHFWQFTSVPRGYVILINGSEFNPVREADLLDLLQKFSDIKRLKLKSEEFPEFILDTIHKEFTGNSKYAREIIHGLLKALLGKLLQLTDAKCDSNFLPQSMFDKFQSALIKECPRLHKVNEYADLLNITPHALNLLCRKQINKSASEIILSQIILEAKRYILHTDNTINEIADIMCFSDPSNFVKFFKKYEGITPIQFREKAFQ